jgi:hypothetical protein
MPVAQQSRLCALVLLALLDLSPGSAWSSAKNPLRGIHQMRQFCIAEYEYTWAENSQESVRKTAIHHFQDARLVVKNPDKPNRPITSGDTVYQLTPDALSVVHAFGTDAFSDRPAAFIEKFGSLVDRYAARRTLEQVPLRLLLSEQASLSAGPHSDLIERIMYEFGPRFTPDGVLIYAGDTERKGQSYFDEAALAKLGIILGDTGTKIPDVMIHYEAKNWLVIVEAFHSGGHIDPLRKSQLEELFAASTAPLVLVTAFHDRKVMTKQAGKLAWETDVWVAEAPDHLIHFNGERFLGPY